MRVMHLAIVIAVVGCNGPTLTESADVPAVDVALDFNPVDTGVGVVRHDVQSSPLCTVGLTTPCQCVGSVMGVQVCTAEGVGPCLCGLDAGTADTGVDVAVAIDAADAGEDVAPGDSVAARTDASPDAGPDAAE